MKINEKFVLVRRNGQNYIECTDKNCSDFNTSIELNETAAYLFKQLKNGVKTKDELLRALLNDFDISTVLALNDIDSFIKTLASKGIIEG